MCSSSSSFAVLEVMGEPCDRSHEARMHQLLATLERHSNQSVMKGVYFPYAC